MQYCTLTILLRVDFMLSILTIKKYACSAYWGYRYYNIKVPATTSKLVYDLPVIPHNCLQPEVKKC